MTWVYKGTSAIDGADMSVSSITADGTLGGRFTSAGGWVTANSKLPGFTGTVDIPSYFFYFSGDGSQGNPYQIGTAAQLAKLSELVNAGNTTYNGTAVYYKLVADIDLSSYGSGFNGGKGWIPVGTNTSQFKGNFDGNSRKITGLYINDTNLDYAGLFGEIYIGSVKNLALENVNISGTHNYVGGVAGYLYGGSITNCYTTGIIKGNDNIGGIAGYNNNSRIENCYSTATVNGNYYIGGIVGYIGAGSISACYSIGAISGNYIIGGIAGLFAAGSITNCVALNPSIKAGSTAGRITGDILSSSSGTLDNNAGWYSIENNAGYTTWSSPGLAAKDGADITMSAIQADGSLGSRFTSAGGWTTANGKLPGLFGSTADMPAFLVPAFTGEGTTTLPYLINNAADLAKLGELVNAGSAAYNGAAYNLTADIDLSPYQSGAGWVPIGYSDSNSFHGAFDGTHKTITNLKINYTGTDYKYAGLFGYVYGGVITYLNVNAAITSGTSYTGGIAGRIDNYATISTCSVTGTVQSTAGNPLYPAGTGGLVGSAGNTAPCTIIYSWSTATVTGSGGDTSTGGAVGFAMNSTITNCYATGAVKSSSYDVGGFAGQLRGTVTLKGCYATGTVNGTNNIGGLVGFIRDGVTVESCYASGSVTGSGDYTGGVAGNSSSCTISNCVALNQSVAGTGTNTGRVVGGIGGTTPTLTNNAAWAGILNKAGATTWGSKAAGTIDGVDIAGTAIRTDGTLGGRTTTASGWNVLNGYLPYLNSNQVAIPAYIN